MKNSLSKHQLKALSNYFQRNEEINISDFGEILNIDNEYGIEALRYIPISNALQIKNKSQIQVLEYYSKRNLTLDKFDFQGLLKIDNVCQVLVIKAGFSIETSFKAQVCIGISDHFHDAL